MEDDDRNQITTKLGQKKWVLLCASIVLLIAVVMILFTIFGGMHFAIPWGKQPGPGP